jgi:amino acid transporter
MQGLSTRLGKSPVNIFTETGIETSSITLYSRDGGLPDRGVFGRINNYTKTPIYSVWLTIGIAILMGCLDWASAVAVQAIFSMCAVALDLSYVIPVIGRRIFEVCGT